MFFVIIIFVFKAKQNPMQAVQAAAAAIGPSGLPSSSTTSAIDDKDNKPSIEILQQVFSTFGEIRCCDIPNLDPFRISNGILGTAAPLSQDTTFDAYVQFSEYIGFVKAMDACRNMKLMLIDDTNTAYTASIKVSFISRNKNNVKTDC
jgi:arginine/serine-rich splicing factor 17